MVLYCDAAGTPVQLSENVNVEYSFPQSSALSLQKTSFDQTVIDFIISSYSLSSGIIYVLKVNLTKHNNITKRI